MADIIGCTEHVFLAKPDAKRQEDIDRFVLEKHKRTFECEFPFPNRTVRVIKTRVKDHEDKFVGVQGIILDEMFLLEETLKG